MALTILDAGVVIAVLDSTDPHHDAARLAISEARDRSDELAVPVSAYAEILVGAYRAGGDAPSTVDDFLAALPARVEPATREIARAAARLRAEHGPSLRLPDALVIATALDRKAAHLITTDSGWPRVSVAVQDISARR
jgi:predicted nucleic acid-binding protein